jgi:hypothetical protein
MLKKILVICVTVFISSAALAEHFFTVCYINYSNKAVGYNNSGYERKWKNRGELIGTGVLGFNETKCFKKISDETIFSTDMMSFTVDGEWFGIVNPGFSHPYVVASYATADTKKKQSKLIDNTKDGRDNYQLYVHIMQDKTFVLSNSADVTDSSQIIKPYKNR